MYVDDRSHKYREEADWDWAWQNGSWQNTEKKSGSTPPGMFYGG